MTNDLIAINSITSEVDTCSLCCGIRRIYMPPNLCSFCLKRKLKELLNLVDAQELEDEANKIRELGKNIDL